MVQLLEKTFIAAPPKELVLEEGFRFTHGQVIAPFTIVYETFGELNADRSNAILVCHALSGDQLWRCNAESRWLIGRDFQHLLSLGGAVFWDAARTWGPGSGGLPWQHDVGFGLRLGFPRSALNRVARLDIAWPVVAYGPGPREAVFSFGSSQAF